jgi:hypothetical protein
MRIALAVALIVASATARAAVPDQDWVGTFRCGSIPNIARIPLVQPVRVEIRGGVAHLERDVRIADTTSDSGHVERDQGTVGPDGAVTLAGGGDAQNSGFRSEYRGVFAPSGQAHFEGAQHWHFDRHPGFDRPCTIDLHRQN